MTQIWTADQSPAAPYQTDPGSQAHLRRIRVNYRSFSEVIRELQRKREEGEIEKERRRESRRDREREIRQSGRRGREEGEREKRGREEGEREKRERGGRKETMSGKEREKRGRERTVLLSDSSQADFREREPLVTSDIIHLDSTVIQPTTPSICSTRTARYGSISWLQTLRATEEMEDRDKAVLKSVLQQQPNMVYLERQTMYVAPQVKLHTAHQEQLDSVVDLSATPI